MRIFDWAFRRASQDFAQEAGVVILRCNEAGLDIIRRFEGCKLTAYRCPAGIPTIGFGHVRGVKMGQTISQAEADEMLLEDVEEVEVALRPMIGHASANEFSALTSFAFNLGVNALRKSTLLKKHIAGDRKGAADEFLKWNKARVKGVLSILPGLTKRRAEERALYLKP